MILMHSKVITTKHHDGFALFDTGASSNRNSLNYGPKYVLSVSSSKIVSDML